MKKMLYAETDEQSNKVLSLLLRPIYRVKEYSCIFEDIDKNFECPADANTIVELQNLHAKISRLSTKFSKKHQRVQESFQVHSFRSETVIYILSLLTLLTKHI